MKILTPRNNKDYYDYLTGIYGIDEKVVFDRRNFTLLSTVDYPIFNYTPNDHDKPKQERRSWERVGNKCKWVINYEATQQFKCMLEVGLKWYLFEIERYLDKSGNVCIDWKHKKQFKSKNRNERQASQSHFTKNIGLEIEVYGGSDIQILNQKRLSKWKMQSIILF